MYPTMIKKGLAAAAALMMLLTAAGCSDQDTSSSTADAASSVRMILADLQSGKTTNGGLPRKNSRPRLWCLRC
mgnify:CR=1 FL=1